MTTHKQNHIRSLFYVAIQQGMSRGTSNGYFINGTCFHFDHNFIKLAEKCSSGLTCKNEGYINVECKCECPLGFTGSTCETVVTDAGE